MGTSSKTSQNTRTSSTSTPTFGAEGQDVLRRLLADVSTLDTNNSGELAKLRTLMSDNPGQNPFTEQAIAASNEEAKRFFDRGQAGVRAQNYRGSTPNNIFQQGEFSNRFAGNLAATNANTRMNQYNADFGNQLAATQGAASITQGNRLSGQNLLSLLRGETSSGTESGTSSQRNRAPLQEIGSAATIALALMAL